PDRDHLDWLESEAIYIMREVAGQCQNPVLFFSGGKDSIVLLRLAEKAFRPGRFPFPLMHIDTGHNFDEVIEFRDRRAAELGERVRGFPIGSWTELAVWQYIGRGRPEVPSIYYAHRRPIVRRRGLLVPVTPLTPPRAGEAVEEVSVRFRTVGDISCTCPVESD